MSVLTILSDWVVEFNSSWVKTELVTPPFSSSSSSWSRERSHSSTSINESRSVSRGGGVVTGIVMTWLHVDKCVPTSLMQPSHEQVILSDVAWSVEEVAVAAVVGVVLVSKVVGHLMDRSLMAPSRALLTTNCEELNDWRQVGHSPDLVKTSDIHAEQYELPQCGHCSGFSMRLKQMWQLRYSLAGETNSAVSKYAWE